MSASAAMTIMPLGAGNEVGRSAILLSFRGKNILLDCGIHPAYEGISSLPFYDAIDPATIDVVLVSHFHLDHIASLPYFTERTAFKGRVFMTHPTKAIYKWLLLDFVKVSPTSSGQGSSLALFDERDLQRSHERITAVDFHQEIEACEGVRFTAYPAGHVLGAAMFMIEIASIRILYTGDYSREPDRHLSAAEHPPGPAPQVMICEATYGVQSHEPQLERERRFTSRVHEIVSRGGKCLLPVFALGKAHELLTILDEYWDVHKSQLASVPIYYASSLTKKCLSIYSTYLHMSSSSASTSAFKYVTSIRSASEVISTSGPCVMMASPGMLQSGLSRELLEAWCGDARNGIILTGYSVEGTLAKSLLAEPSEITALASKRMLPFKMSVESISFSAHVDFVQNVQFIDAIRPEHLILVHGEYNEMMRLKNALQTKYDARTDQKTRIHTPRNCESLELVFCERRVARVVGSLAAKEHCQKIDNAVALMDRNWDLTIVAPEEIHNYAPKLRQGAPGGSICVRTTAPFSLVYESVIQLLGTEEPIAILKPNHSFSLFNSSISIEILTASSTALISWKASSPLIDMLADSVVSLISTLDGSPAAVIATRSTCAHGSSSSLQALLSNYYEKVLEHPDGTLEIDAGEKTTYRLSKEKVANDSLTPKEVAGPSEAIARHIRHIVTLHELSC